MSGIKRFLTGTIIMMVCLEIRCQTDFDLENYLQNLLPTGVENFENADIYESLINYYQHPLDLNKADRSEIGSLYILNNSQINSLLNYRLIHGGFLSIYELQAVPEFDLETIKILKNFVTVGDRSPDTRKFKERLQDPEIQYIILRYDRTLERKRGFSDDVNNPYLGSQDKYLMRYRLQRYRDYSIGLTLEKDAGELSNWNPSKGIYLSDFQSFHFSLENQKRFEQLTVGDYQLGFGQGLVFSAGFNLGKGAETILSVKRNESGIRPYGSAMEYGFMRGIAFKYNIGKVAITPFLSLNHRDGRIVDGEENGVHLSSVSSSGFHRTENELKKKNAFFERLFGAHFEKGFSHGSIGVLFARRNWELPLLQNEAIHNEFDFEGYANHVGSIHYDFQLGGNSVFGESAISKSGGFGTLHGAIIPVSRNTDMSILYRRFDPSFHTIAGAPFAEYSKPNNESGIYIGLKHKISKRWTVSAFADSFRNPWPKMNIRSPGNGQEAFIRIDQRINKEVDWMLQYRFGQYDYTQSNSWQSYSVFKRRQDEWILQIRQSPTEHIHLRTRVQSKGVNTAFKSNGYIISQDIQYVHKFFTFSGRLAYFSTDDYDTRFYILERDVLYSLSAPAYFGQGVRQYMLVKYRLNKSYVFWLKWARSIRRNALEMGSGNEAINGNRRNDIRFQLKISF